MELWATASRRGGKKIMGYKITVLAENTAPEYLEAEHGLSFFVETPTVNFLLDCGQTAVAWRNAEKLGIDVSRVEFVVLSHSHYDHAGGFPLFAEKYKPKLLYTGPTFWQEKFSYDKETGQCIYRGCGFTKWDLASWEIEQRVCRDVLSLNEEAMLITGFTERYPFEQIPKKFLRGVAKEPDSFDDEICLLLKGSDGLTLVVGCSHRGILNIVSSVLEKTKKPVKRIIGGIHLKGAGEERKERTLKELKRLGVSRLNLCHCSGIELPSRISTGSVVYVE